ncbi:amino acid permease [Lysobacter soli]|jgi:basic amino acid/polyamine antiporter, APA family|uniref:Amino acid permease n=1 Tax=Lysobacter soli TaxID=453783 RepID=A0A3D8VGB6_9GAMM|nr:amino acid permease [Lysobacter soli]MDG2518320.1 amino acid permease [Lysobacter soli]RDY68365.1 amino acid permease [Lysobacter soli]
MFKNLFLTKPVEPAGHVDAGEPVEGSLQGEATLKRSLTATQLVMLGIGAVIGAGIFVLSGHAAAEHAGPAIVISFIIAGFACALAGLCYAEFAAMLPVSGSAYSYSYATLGEFVAWFIGWNLVLEYMFAASTVAVGWSGYLNSFLGSFNMALPASLAAAPLNVVEGSIVYTGGLINLPAVFIVAALSGLCYVGITQSAIVNSVIVAIKVIVIVMFVAFAAQYVNPDNWVPFVPENQGPGRYGIDGIIRGASVVFFAYIGFDAVSTAAGEAKNPQRDMPIGILGSLVICTIIYIIVALVLTGLLPYPQLSTPKPVATALEAYPSLLWLKHVVELGAIAGLSSVILVMLMGQPRIFYSMAKDGLLPKVFAKVHPKFQTPYMGTIYVGVFACLLAGFLPIGLLGELVSMGTLLAFATVSIGVLVLRKSRPDLPRPFRVPAAAIICPLGAAACLYLFWKPFSEHWPLMTGWTVIGLLIYFFYGYRNSKVRQAAR